MQETEATISTSRRSKRLRVAERRSFSISSLSLAVLLDVGVGARDVGFGLVVVVVADEVLDGVVGEELFELGVELRGQRLVGRQHQRRPLHSLDHLRDGERLAAAGHAEQRLVLVAALDALDQLLNRRGLIARRLERRDHLEVWHTLDLRFPGRDGHT